MIDAQQLAPIEPQTAAPIPKPQRERRIPKRIAQAIELLATGECETQKAAAMRVDITQEHLCRMLAKDHIRVFIERRTRQTIAAGLMPAAARVVNLIHAGSEHVSLDASKHLLGIAGIAPTPTQSVNVNIELKAGYVLDLRENPGNGQLVEHNQSGVCPPVGQTETE